MAKLYKLLLVVAASVTIFLGLTACTAQNADVEPTRTPTLAGSLQPYQSPAPSMTPLPPTLAPTETPLPTVTPHLYPIALGDTMGSIALEFGVTTNDLIAVNPNVPPFAMSVGKELLIPDSDERLMSPTFEPLALEVLSPSCYPTLNDGMWCFVSVLNTTNAAAENISAEISLFDKNGRLIARKVAFPLVDRVAVGEQLSLLTYFADTPADLTAYATLLTALLIPDGYMRYYSVSLRNVLTEIAWDGSFADVSGDVLVDREASQIWVVATAYDGNEQIVGVRRWESDSDEATFYLTVASLGHAIERVELIVQAKR